MKDLLEHLIVPGQKNSQYKYPPDILLGGRAQDHKQHSEKVQKEQTSHQDSLSQSSITIQSEQDLTRALVPPISQESNHTLDSSPSSPTSSLDSSQSGVLLDLSSQKNSGTTSTSSPPRATPSTTTQSPYPTQPKSSLKRKMASAFEVNNVNTHAMPHTAPDPLLLGMSVDDFLRLFTGESDNTAIPSSSLRNATAPSPSPGPEVVKQLYELCQARGFLPDLDCEEPLPQRFVGTLKVRDRVFRSSQHRENKNAARQDVAAMGLDFVRGLPLVTGKAARRLRQQRMQQAYETVGTGMEREENWVGILNEFCAAEALALPDFIPFKIGQQRFAFEVDVALDRNAANGALSQQTLDDSNTPSNNNDHTQLSRFGSRDRVFPNLKAAKADAAREAVEWLIANGRMDENGVSMRKKRASRTLAGSAAYTSPIAPGDSEKNEYVSTKQRVDELCRTLNFGNLQYHFEKSLPATSIFSCSASFAQNPYVHFLSQPPNFTLQSSHARGRLGHVQNVYGRENAKEECARLILPILEEEVRVRKGGYVDSAPASSSAAAAAAAASSSDDGDDNSSIKNGTTPSKNTGGKESHAQSKERLDNESEGERERETEPRPSPAADARVNTSRGKSRLFGPDGSAEAKKEWEIKNTF